MSTIADIPIRRRFPGAEPNTSVIVNPMGSKNNVAFVSLIVVGMINRTNSAKKTGILSRCRSIRPAEMQIDPIRKMDMIDEITIVPTTGSPDHLCATIMSNRWYAEIGSCSKDIASSTFS